MKKTIPLVVQATPVKEELPVRGREARRAPKSYGTPARPSVSEFPHPLQLPEQSVREAGVLTGQARIVRRPLRR
jgi:hypothetical protein